MPQLLELDHQLQQPHAPKRKMTVEEPWALDHDVMRRVEETRKKFEACGLAKAKEVYQEGAMFEAGWSGID